MDIFKYIPKNLVLKTLIWPKTQSRVLILGVEKRDHYHASFIFGWHIYNKFLDILSSLDYTTILTQISPDMPYFIKTENSFQIAWKNYLKGKKDYKFIVSTNPHYISDINISQQKTKFLVEGSFRKAPNYFEIGSTYLYSLDEKNTPQKEKRIDNYLTPFLYSYNNLEKNLNIVVSDFPELKYRDIIVRSIGLDELKDLLKMAIEENEKYNFNFDPKLIRQDIFIKPKIGYLTELIKHACHYNKNIIAILDRHCIDFIEEEWQKISQKIEPIQKYLKKSDTEENILMNYSEYIEKLAILDILLGTFINDNFVTYKSFPFDGKDTIGNQTFITHTFLIWNYFFDKYKNKFLSKNTDFTDIYSEKLDLMEGITQPDKKYKENEDSENESEEDSDQNLF